MNTSEQIDKLAEALAVAEVELKNPQRNRTVKVRTKSGQEYRFRYATLDEILDVVRPVLSKHGLALIGSVNGDGYTARLAHSSGQWVETVVPVLAREDGPQAYGSALTYARRYAITSLLPIAAEEDDDANGAEGNHAEPVKPREPSEDVMPQWVKEPAAKTEAAPPCPKCGKADHVIASKFGPEWYCLKGKGCGYKWPREQAK